MLFWHVPAPNEALLISGSKRRTGDAQFRIVTGHGCWVMPVKQKASVLALSLREAEISEDCVTQQGIRIGVRAVAVFKVGDDQTSIANAARRFLDEQTTMEELVGRIFAGHLRSIVGGLTVEQIIRERDRVAQEVKEGSHSEMEKLGIVVDALQIQEIADTSGYITNLRRPARRGGRERGPDRAGQGRPGGHRAGTAGGGAEGRVRAGHRDQAGRVPRRDRAVQRPRRTGGPAVAGQGLAGGHRGADLAGPAAGLTRRPAAGGRGAPPGGRRGLPAAHPGRGTA